MMTEENTAVIDKLEEVQEIVEDATEETTEEEAVEYSAAEIKAMEKGWTPDKEAVPEGKEWIPADEFLRNESFFSEIRKLKRELNNTKKSFDVLKEHHRKVAEIEKEKVLADLKRQKKLALEEDDHDAVVEIDDRILEAKTQANDYVEQQEVDNSAFESWIDRNPWYETNPELKKLADDIGAGYYATHNTNGHIDPNQLYSYVEQQIKTIKPEIFAPKSRTRAAPTVEGAASGRGSRGSKKPKHTEKDLDDNQRAVMNRFVREGVLSKEEYIEELARIGEI